MKKKIFKKVLIVSASVLAVLTLCRIAAEFFSEKEALKRIAARFQADTRAAEVLVTGVNYDQVTGKTNTTIKFLEYDSEKQPLEPKYFTFAGNIIQFQSLVIRFDDKYVGMGHPLKGKSVYLFWKVFTLDGKNTREYEITSVDTVPAGYKVKGIKDAFQEKLWKNFWAYVVNPANADKIGIKNAQIEAPGTMFIPGRLYTVKIEHDGGLRVDSSSLPAILKGEKIL